MNKVLLAIIGVLLIIILFLRQCSPSAKCPEVKGKLDTTFIKVHDTIREVKLVPVTKIVDRHPEPVTITDTVFLTEVQPVDTMAILKDYFATRNYSDTNHIAYGSFIIQDAISQNKIRNRQIIYNLNIPTVKETVAVNPKNQVYLGLDIGGTGSWISFGPQFTLKTSTDKMYHLGASYTTENKFYFHIGTDWKIHF